MFRYTEIRNAFAMSVLVIFLCLIALTGSTFALFTSDPEDGKIGVITTSGIVDVDIVEADSGRDNSIIGDVLHFHSDTTDQGGIIIEPGATIYTQGFKIKNRGNVTLNYRMYITNDSDIDMGALDSSCEFYVTTDPHNFSDAQKIYELNGQLKAGECSDTYYLVMKMHTHVDNDFQGHIFTGIGITVYATQGNAKIEEMK